MSPAEVSVGRFRLQLGRVMSLASGRAIVGVVTSFLETPQTAVSKKARTAILGLSLPICFKKSYLACDINQCNEEHVSRHSPWATAEGAVCKQARERRILRDQAGVMLVSLRSKLPFAGRCVVISFLGSRLEQSTVPDEDGSVIPGFSAEACDPIFGNEISRVVGWSNEADLTALAGQTVRMRVVMKDADLYSFRFH